MLEFSVKTRLKSQIEINFLGRLNKGYKLTLVNSRHDRVLTGNWDEKMSSHVHKSTGLLVPEHIINAPMRRPGLPNEAKSVQNDPPSVKNAGKVVNCQELARQRWAALNRPKAKKSALLDVISHGKVDDLVVYNTLVDLLKNIENESGIDFFVESLFHNMLSEAANAVAVSKYVFVLSHQPKKGAMLRSSFFKFLQKHYNERKIILISRGGECFKNFVYFFTAAVHHNRDPQIAPFNDLMFSLLDLAEMFSSYLDTPSDIKLFCILLVRFSQYHSLDPKLYSKETIEKYSKMKFVIRNKLKDVEKWSENNLWLMMALDSINEEVLYEFYANNMAEKEMTPVLKESYTIQLPRSDLKLYNILSMESYLNLI